MAMDRLEVPPLPFLELWRPRPDAIVESVRRQVLPEVLEDELARIAKRAVQVGVDPVLSASPDLGREEACTFLNSAFGEFARERSHIWPPLLLFLKTHWFTLFPLLREVTSAVRTEREKVSVPDVDDDSPGAKSLLRLGMALKTYELTVEMMLGSVTPALTRFSAGHIPPELKDSESSRALLHRMDHATAGLEFGTIAAIRMMERRGAVGTAMFGYVTEFTMEAADDQHVLLRSVLRAVMGEDSTPIEVVAEGTTSVEEAPPEALLTDWVRAILAA